MGWPKGRRWTEEQLVNLRTSRQSSGYRAKISVIRQGKSGYVRSKAHREQMGTLKKGVRNPNWTGDEASYSAAHRRHRKVLPPNCEQCGKQPEGRGNECALRHDTPSNRLMVQLTGACAGKRYSVDSRDYMRLCAGCHRRYDAARRRALQETLL